MARRRRVVDVDGNVGAACLFIHNAIGGGVGDEVPGRGNRVRGRRVFFVRRGREFLARLNGARRGVGGGQVGVAVADRADAPVVGRGTVEPCEFVTRRFRGELDRRVRGIGRLFVNETVLLYVFDRVSFDGDRRFRFRGFARIGGRVESYESVFCRYGGQSRVRGGRVVESGSDRGDFDSVGRVFR